MYLFNYYFWCSLFHFVLPPFHLLKVINLIYTFEFFQFFIGIFLTDIVQFFYFFHCCLTLESNYSIFLTIRIILCSYLRCEYHMYLFYVKVKLNTKHTYYLSGVRLYNKGKILVVHYVI